MKNITCQFADSYRVFLGHPYYRCILQSYFIINSRGESVRSRSDGDDYINLGDPMQISLIFTFWIFCMYSRWSYSRQILYLVRRIKYEWNFGASWSRQQSHAVLVLGWVTISTSVCNQPPRPTQPCHPCVGVCREYWQWYRPPLAKKQWVLLLHNSRSSCHQDVWHTDLVR